MIRSPAPPLPRSSDDPLPEPHFESGTVTRVAQQQRDAERVSVFVNDRFAFGLALDLAVAAGLRKGLALSADEQRALVARERTHRVRGAALDYLSYQARTTAEVRRKLREKGFDAAAVEDALAYVARHGYLDDEAYARAYVRGRFAGRGLGPERLRQELLRRGVDRETVEGALGDLVEAEDLLEAALRQGRPRWRALAHEPDARKRRQKTLAFLVRRGFAFDLARDAVERLGTDDTDDAAWEE